MKTAFKLVVAKQESINSEKGEFRITNQGISFPNNGSEATY